MERIEYLFRSVSSQAAYNKFVIRYSISLDRGRLSCNVRYKKEIVTTVPMTIQCSFVHSQLTVKSFPFLLCVVL